jgi:hypothetical protein
VTAVTGVELLVLEQKWFQQLLLPSASGSIDDEMARREAMVQGGSRPNSAGGNGAAAQPTAASSSSKGGAAADAKKTAKAAPQKNVPPFEELKILTVIGTGTFGRVKLAQHEKTSRVRGACLLGFLLSPVF